MNPRTFVITGLAALLVACSGNDATFRSNGSSSSATAGGGGGGGGAGGAAACSSAADCAALTVGCDQGRCDDGHCVVAPADDGTACNEANLCAQGTCMGGTCVEGPPPDCGGFTTTCTLGQCDPMAGCVARPANEGAPCSDGDTCSTGDACKAGACVPAVQITMCVDGDGCCLPNCASDSDCKPLSQPSYSAVKTFKDALGCTPSPMAWDGTHYWTGCGNNKAGVNYAEFDASGMLVSTYKANLDFRSVFVKGASPTVYAHPVPNYDIYVQTSPGVFAIDTSLTLGFQSPQSPVVYDADVDEYIEMGATSVRRYDKNGTWVTDVILQGYGTKGLEGQDPQELLIASGEGYWLTYSDGNLSAWDKQGNRVAMTSLVGAGTSTDSYWSFSHTNGLVWVLDGELGTWRGYDVGL